MAGINYTLGIIQSFTVEVMVSCWKFVAEVVTQFLNKKT